MTRQVNRIVLTSHITFSVGWLGAVAVFLALAITALHSQDVQLVRACCLAMDITAWFIILPFALTSLTTGIVQALGTKWGLFNHYWIAVKLFLTVVSTILLLLHMQPISSLAVSATETPFSYTESSSQIIDLIKKAGAAIIALLFIVTISVFKPWGKIQKRNEGVVKESPKSSFKLYSLIGLAILILLVIIKHLFASGHGH